MDLMPTFFVTPETFRQYSLNKTVNQHRFIKRGTVNLKVTKIPNKWTRYTKDLANTFITIKWRWVILAIIVINWSFYLILTGFFLFDAYVSGDFTPNKTEGFCINGVTRTGSITGFLLLSIETVTSTGYGYKYPTEYCNFLPLNMTVGHLMAFMLDGALISALFLKIARPMRQDFPVFSKRAVICVRNGRMCLILRVYDLFKKHSISPRIKLYLIQEKNTALNYLSCLEIEDFGLLFWPTEIVHVIDEDSPFYKLGPYDFLKNRFEMVVEVCGCSMATCQSSVSRQSYLNKDVLWGHQFLNCMTFDKQKRNYCVNFEMFNQTIRTNILLCSAEVLQQIEDNVQLEV